MFSQRKISVLVAVCVMFVMAGSALANGNGGDDPNIDIKPGSFPNSINPRSRGNIPVAILGSAEFDVSDVDVSTVMLEGVSPLSAGLGAIEDVNGDGFQDMVFHFDTQAVIAAVGGCVTEMTQTGDLLDGTPFSATDSVRILGCPNGASLAAGPGVVTMAMLAMGGVYMVKRKRQLR